MNPTSETITSGLRGLKPPVEIPQTPVDAIWPVWQICLAAGLGLLVVALVTRWFLQRRNNRQASPEQIALAALDRLSAGGADRDNDAFVMDVTTILRRYIEAGHPVPALRLSTEEFLQSLASQDAATLQEHRAALQEFLNQCDLVKFARGELDPCQRDTLIQCASDFINQLSTPKTQSKAA